MTIIIGGFIYLFYSRSQPRPQSVLSPLKGALTWVERCVGFKCNWFLSIDLSTISHDYVWNIFYFDCLSIRVRHAVIQTWLLEITSFIWWYKSKEVQSRGGEILFRHFSLFFFFFLFFQECNPFVWKTADKYPHLPHVKICQSISSPLIFFSPSCSYWDGLEEILKRPFEMDQSWQSGYLVTPSFSSACITISLNRPFVLPLSKLWSLA